ncbi:MAG: hypothetical protein GXP41_11675 [Chloroflexi bacterium]|nr:hypothetical protein [Chloroflexota bacterium]
MFRRRPRRRPPLWGRFRRRPPGPPGRPPLPPETQKALAQAHVLMAEGQFVAAAQAFARLSDEVKEEGLPGRAANLALQAARAYLAADSVEAAVQWATTGIGLFVRGGRAGRVNVVLPKITSALRNKGHEAEAVQVEQEAKRLLDELGLSLDELGPRGPQMAETRGTLPAQCTSCGAPLVPHDVEWHDNRTAECPYCGSILKAAS